MSDKSTITLERAEEYLRESEDAVALSHSRCWPQWARSFNLRIAKLRKVILKLRAQPRPEKPVFRDDPFRHSRTAEGLQPSESCIVPTACEEPK